MYLALNFNNFKKNNIMFSSKMKNNILHNGYFHKIFYSDEYFTSNGIIFKFKLKNVYVENYFNKIKCSFDKIINEAVIENIKRIERLLLLVFKLNRNITPIYRVEEQLKNSCLKIFSDRNINYGSYKNINLILKISGIWINGKDFGITFRFFISN
tara:strand:+ start:4210 stop:4674 length:465 start_codon:yes stop_codon:yes gene_type:complete